VVTNVGEELSRLVSIRSESGYEQEILIYLEERLRRLGLTPFRQIVVDDRFNLIWSDCPDPKVLFSAHVDTVPAFGHPDQYSPRLEGSRLYGRGSVDTKAGIAAILIALEMAIEDGIELGNCAVAFTVDEERDGLGSRVLPQAIRARGAVVLEPTGLTICPAEVGSIEVKIEILGTPAHGGEFETGQNPILKAVSLIKAFENLSFVRNGYHPLIGKGGFNVMEIKGGGDILLVPERCELFVDFRILPGQDVEAAKRELVELFRREDVKAEFVDVEPPFELKEDEPVVKLLKQAYYRALGKEPRIGGIKSWTDAGYLVLSGIPSVVFGPGKLSVAHTPWEYVDLDEVEAAARVLRVVIEEACEFI
jgi:acetylornithine deacetylase